MLEELHIPILLRALRFALIVMLPLHLLLTALFLPLVLSAPAAQPTAEDSGISFEKRADSSLPLLKLPYGTWRAAKYDSSSDVRFNVITIYFPSLRTDR